MIVISTHWSDALSNLKACRDAVEWAKTQPDFATAWSVCERGDWMIWLAALLSGEQGSPRHREIVLAACECARLPLPIYETKHPNDDRPRKIINIVEAWARGDAGVTLDDVRKVRADAYTVAYTAAYAAAHAVVVTVSAAAIAVAVVDAFARSVTIAFAARAAAVVDAVAASAAATVAVATDDGDACAYVAATCAARASTLKQCADIVRAKVTIPDLEAVAAMEAVKEPPNA